MKGDLDLDSGRGGGSRLIRSDSRGVSEILEEGSRSVDSIWLRYVAHLFYELKPITFLFTNQLGLYGRGVTGCAVMTLYRTVPTNA